MIDLIIDLLMEILPEVFISKVSSWYEGPLQRIPWKPPRLFIFVLLLLSALLVGIALPLVALGGLILLAMALGLISL